MNEQELHKIPNPEATIEERVIDLIIKENGKINQLTDVHAEITYDSGDLTIIRVENRIYPVKRQIDDKLFYVRKTYTDNSSWEDPLTYGLLGFSVFMNVQQWWSPDNLFTLPNMILLVIIGFILYKWTNDRAKNSKSIVYIKKSMQMYESPNLKDSAETLSIYYPNDKGWSTTWIFAAILFGMGLTVPFTLASLAWEWEFTIAILAAFSFLYFTLARPKSKEANPSVYSPTVIAQMKKSDDVKKGEKIYADLGVIAKINTKGKTKKEIAEQKKSLETKYKDAVIVGFAAMEYYENVMETNEVNWQTIISEAFDHNVVEDQKFKILKQAHVEEVLQKSKKTLDDSHTNTFLEKTIKDVVREYAENIKLLYNALVWTNQQNKTLTSIAKSDKQIIGMQTRVIAANEAISHKEPKITDPVDVDRALKWAFIGLIGFGILWGYFALTSNGFI